MSSTNKSKLLSRITKDPKLLKHSHLQITIQNLKRKESQENLNKLMKINLKILTPNPPLFYQTKPNIKRITNLNRLKFKTRLLKILKEKDNQFLRVE